MCLMNMKRRKIRTFLTVLGVMIGVISVVALLAVGIGVKNEMIDSAVASGSVNQITIYSETGRCASSKVKVKKQLRSCKEAS